MKGSFKGTDSMISLYVKTTEDMEKLGRHLAAYVQPNDVICLSGVLGAGKTTLVRGLAEGLGFQGRVHSPTFTLMNIYSGNMELYHLDFYRLGSAQIDGLGLEDYMTAGGVTMIEWAEFGTDVLPEADLVIEIALMNEDYERERRVTLAGNAPHYNVLLEEKEAFADFSY